MRSKIARLLTLLLVFVFQISFAQEISVSGVVTDETNNPLPGVSVVKEGTSEGTTTGLDGEYTIKAKKGDKLTFSFVGMTSQTVLVNGSQININLKDDVSVLQEVVVNTGYTTSVKAKSNIAAQVVSSETIQNRPNQSFVQTLQGQVAGLNIQTGSGEPGAASSIILRGAASFSGATDPLFVIDGVHMSSTAFRSLNPNEIESVNVLKDAGATAIYGNRGAKGVIVVTTKRGGYETPLTFNYIGSSGVSFMQSNDYNVMNSKELLALEKSRGLGRGVTLTDQEIANYNINTNWRDVFLRTGINQNHTLNFQSGGKSLSNFTSIGFSDTQGIVRGSDLMKFNLRTNTNGKSKRDNFKYSTTTNLNYSKRRTIGSTGTGGVNQNLLLGAFKSVPWLSPNEYVDGADLLENFTGMSQTPLLLMDKMKTYFQQYDEFKAIVNLKGDLKLAKGLNFISSASFDYTHQTTNGWQSPKAFNSLYFQEPDQQYGGWNTNASLRQFSTNILNQLKYNFTINDVHTFEVSALTEYIKAHYRLMSGTQEGLDPVVAAPGHGQGWIPYDGTPYYVPSVSASSFDSGMFSYFGYLDYDYNTKYGFNATIRRDASYRFNNTNRWGTFWAVSGRWNISNEEFLKDTAFNQLKLRGSYGTTGNDIIEGSTLFDARNYSRQLYALYNGYNNVPGYGLSQLANVDLKWETTYQADLGLDFELFDSRLRGSFDAYHRKTKDLFLLNPIAWQTGQPNLSMNKAEVVNKGLEAVLAYDVIKNNDEGFNLTVKGNVGYNHNEIISLGNRDTTWDGSSLNGNWVGKKMYEYYLIPYAGVNPATGNALFLDRNNNLTETPDQVLDRRYTGSNYLPEFQGGFGLDIDYKGFYASAFFTFVTGIDRYDYDYAGLMDGTDLGTFNLSRDILNAWTPDNRNTNVPALNYSNNDLIGFSDRFLTDASYLRLRNLSVGYNFSKKTLQSTALAGLKIFAMAENLTTWSKWRGWDAESNRAADQYQYPTPRSISVGLEVQF